MGCSRALQPGCTACRRLQSACSAAGSHPQNGLHYSNPYSHVLKVKRLEINLSPLVMTGNQVQSYVASVCDVKTAVCRSTGHERFGTDCAPTWHVYIFGRHRGTVEPVGASTASVGWRARQGRRSAAPRLLQVIPTASVSRCERGTGTSTKKDGYRYQVPGTCNIAFLAVRR